MSEGDSYPSLEADEGLLVPKLFTVTGGISDDITWNKNPNARNVLYRTSKLRSFWSDESGLNSSLGAELWALREGFRIVVEAFTLVAT